MTIQKVSSMIDEILIPTDRFTDSKITGLKKKNFFFGKNGTGKSTITEEIYAQYSNEYNVRIFQGFQRIIQENGGLNTIALGEKNSILQPEIDKKTKEIEEISANLGPSSEKEENEYTNLEKSKIALKKAEQEKNSFYKKAASEIKYDHTDWTGPKYDMRDFKKDIPNAQMLSEAELDDNISISTQVTLKIKTKIPLRTPTTERFLEAVNEIITKNITQSVILDFESSEKENWVKQGLHLHQPNDKCLFCGSVINKSRFDELNNCFNAEMQQLELRINNAILKINGEIDNIKSISGIEKNLFYPKYQTDVNDLNLAISKSKEDYIRYFEKLLAKLKKRKNNIFVPQNLMELVEPDDFQNHIVEYEKLYNQNMTYNLNLENEKKNAQGRLRLDQVARKLKDNSYDEMKKRLILFEDEYQKNKDKFDTQENKLKAARQELNKLLEQTVDETRAAENINKLLKSLGNQSFTLAKIDTNQQQGQYAIKGADGELRDIETLSTGEKNIVAFLWFIFDLENTENQNEREMIVVFDDPMNSNDDTVQYLIISELQNLLKSSKDKQIFIMTHNAHFYINVRYQWWNGVKKGSYDKVTYHLLKNDAQSIVRLISNPEEDLKTGYDAMWEEVHWLYNQHKPDYMINPLRRIFETFAKFNGIDNIYKDDGEAKKLFDVNSHSIDDLEAELNGKDENALMKKVEDIFSGINAIDHFNKYWNR